MNQRNDRPDASTVGASYGLHDVQDLRRQAELRQGEVLSQGWVTAGTFFFYGLLWIGRTVLGLFDAIFSAVLARTAYEELERLDDAGLAERGLTRADIPAYLAAIMGGAPFRRQPVQGELFAVSGRRPANADHPQTVAADRQAA